MTAGAEGVRVAYNLLPPPAASTPAKYWTSVSLWLHSYTVARTFQELLEEYSKVKEMEVPGEEEAFAMGFIHDLGQKLKLGGRPSLKRLQGWLMERLEASDFTSGEAKALSKYVFTNPAETLRDPLYPRPVWRLLWIADRLQGTDNPLDIPQMLSESEGDLDIRLNLALLNITIPQPFLRSLLSVKVFERILEARFEDGTFLVPISTPFGLAIITDAPKFEVELDWDEVREGFEKGGRLIPEAVEEDLRWNMECCEDPKCRERCGGKSKPPECKQHNYKKRDCERGVYLREVGNSYRIALLYYGRKNEISGDIFLPEGIRNSFLGIKMQGVEFEDGDKICPICGLNTPVGVVGDFLIFFFGRRRLTPEQWSRRLHPDSVNRLMQEGRRYVVDPLCLGEAIIRSQIEQRYLISLTLKALMPLQVMIEVGRLMGSLLYSIGGRRAINVMEFVYNEDGFSRRFDEVIGGIEKVTEIPRFYYDAFSATLSIPYRRDKGLAHQEEWLRDVVTPGILAAWGLYPLVISETIPSSPSSLLLTYYKGRRPLYSFEPSDRRLGGYTPYVATAMMSIAVLNRRSMRENLPAVLEVLDYPPELSPLLLQYGSPEMYSLVESLRYKMGVVA